MKNEITTEAIRAVPAVTVTGLTLFGVSLQDWVLIGSGIFITMQIIHFAWTKFIKPWRIKHGR